MYNSYPANTDPPKPTRSHGPSFSRPSPLLLALALLALSAHAPAAPAAPEKPLPSRRPPIVKAYLSNGLKLLCRTNDSSEIVSVVCQVRAGLPDETEEQAGLAALTAEALLGGTTTQSAQSFTNAVAGAGGNLRAVPGFDFTEISIVTSRDQFEPAIKLLGDVVAHPRFEADDVNKAKEALKRRTAALRDDFTGASYQTLVAQLYPHTPYGRPITGFAQTLDALTQADVKKFWQSTYVQNRMVVAVVGDVDAAKALQTAQKAFQDVPHGQNAAPEPPGMARLTRSKMEAIQRSGPAAQLMVGYLAPPATRASYPVYAVLDAIVGGGRRARLWANIREKHSIGYELGSFYQPLAFQSHVVGYVITPPFRKNPKTEQPESLLEPVKGYLVDQYQQLSVTGPTDQELARAKAYVVGRYALRQERTRDQAKWLAWNVAMNLGEDFDDYFAARVASVTKEEILAAAKKSLTNYCLVMTVPDS